MKHISENENIIPAVEKTVRMLNSLTQSEDGVTQNELAKSLGLTASTGYRIIQTLLKHNWIEKKKNGKYDLANGLLPMMMRFHKRTPFWEDAQMILNKLARKTMLSCKLSLRQGDEYYTLARAESPGAFAVSGKIGVSFPVIEGSVGAAMLCRTEKTEIEMLISHCRVDLTEKHNPYIIYDGIRQYYEKGYVLNVNQNRWKIGAMSIPVFDREGRVPAAVTLIGFRNDFEEEKLTLYKDSLLEAADALK